MSTLLQSLAGRAEGTRIVPLYDDALVCCSRTGWLGWTLAYLLRGTFGNYLLGEPPFDDALARAGESIGGIATVLPFRTGFDADARRWFRRFGCEWIHPLSPVPGPVRTRALGEAAFAGLDQVSCIERRGRYRWRFRWRHRLVEAGLLEPAVARDRSSLALPGRFAGPWWALEARIAGMQSAFVEITPSEWLERELADPTLVCWPIDALGLIACYDDSDYERHDIDFVGPKARAQLAELLSQRGFSRLNAHCYRRERVIVRISRPPRMVMSGPVEPLSLTRGEVQFVTATQAAFHLLLGQEPLTTRLDELERLLLRLPVNLGKLETVLLRRPELLAGEDPGSWLTRWHSLQREAADYYRHHRPDGLRGRLYSRR